MTNPTSTTFVLLLVFLASITDLAIAERPLDAAATVVSYTAKHPMASAGGDGATDDAAEVNGMMQCMVGCFTQVMACAFGCMGKGPDLPLCVISCNQKSIVCMIRCGLTPSPPGPKPSPPAPTPTPKPPAPKPSPPKPPGPPGPPIAGHNTETTD